MRIVLLANQNSVHTRRWAGHLRRRGHDLHVVTCGSGGDSSPPYPVHDLGRPRLGRAGYLLKLWRARRVVRALAPDVLHAHYATSYGLLAVVSAVHPLVVTAHGDDVLISPRNPLMRRLVSHVLRSAEVITVPGEHMRIAVQKLLRGRPREIQVFQYGVETSRLSARAAGERRQGGPLRIASVRPLSDEYRVDVLLAALERLSTRDVEYVCDVVGSGPALNKLRQLAVSLNVAPRVTFLGQLDEEDVESILASAHVYVSVAASDGASLALLEAMSLGAVPVVSDIPANRPWVDDGITGILVQIEPGSLADGIERAAGLDRGEAARRNLEVVRRRADRETNLDAFERSLHKLCAEGGR